MSRFAPWLVLAAVVTAFALILATIYQRRLGRDLYPPYSTFRSDPQGLRVLHDVLASLEAYTVERWLRPLAQLEPPADTTLVVAGLRPAADEQWLSPEERRVLLAAARRGSRVVLAFRSNRETTDSRSRSDPPASKASPKSEAEPTKTESTERLGVSLAPGVITDDARHWRGLDRDGVMRLTWASRQALVLADDLSWTIHYTVDGHPVVAERAVGRGQVVVIADGYLLSNEALQRLRHPALVAELIGSPRRVWFVESHLGVQLDPGLAALARRYGLRPVLALLLLIGALWGWRQLVPLVPVPESTEESLPLAYDPTAGLEALLRRAVAPADLLPTAVAEWSRTADASERARVQAALADPRSPVETFNRAQQALRQPLRTSLSTHVQRCS